MATDYKVESSPHHLKLIVGCRRYTSDGPNGPDFIELIFKPKAYFHSNFYQLYINEGIDYLQNLISAMLPSLRKVIISPIDCFTVLTNFETIEIKVYKFV